MTRTALITGATSGIGLELAHLFAHDHYDLVLVARSAKKLKELSTQWPREHGIKVRGIAKDLSNPKAAREIFNELWKKKITVDVLVNNAGFGSHGAFATASVDEQMQMIHLNVVTLTHLTRLFLPEMVERKFGRVLNLASTAAFQPGPFMAVYYASKAYVLSFSEALAEELRGSGVTVTALCPGPTPTEFQQRAGVTNTIMVRGALPMLTAAQVAAQGYHGLMSGKRIVVPGVVNKIGVQSIRFSPRWLPLKIVKRLHQD